MARVLILGGGFGGVVAAERLAERLSDDHQITLVSRSRQFVFYPALVRLAFGKCDASDVSFDLRHSMLDRRVNFIEAEVARIDPFERKVVIAHGEVEGTLPYDYLIFALGRRLATERITGFYEHANHLLNVDKALKFGKAIGNFHEGRAIIGQCSGARLPGPVYETSFALARLLEERGEREQTRLTIVSPSSIEEEFVDPGAASLLKKALETHQIEFLPNTSIEEVNPNSVVTNDGRALDCNLLMLIPPFLGSPAASFVGTRDAAGYLNVDSAMHVFGVERIYAVGDCVNFNGPKLGHMAVRQGEVAAANVAAEIEEREPVAKYQHEMRLIVDEGGSGSIYLHKDLRTGAPGTVKQNRFWSWAKQVHQEYWQGSHA